MLIKLPINSLIRSNQKLVNASVGCKVARSLSDKPKNTKKETRKVINEDACSIPTPPKKTVSQNLAKPGKPSNKYEVPEYFQYNEYSYNDLLKELEAFRNPQPKAK